VRYLQQWRDLVPFVANQSITIDTTNGQDVWVLSDPHLGHNNIIKYCDRPFANVDAMNNALIHNYLDVVKPTDVVIFGGDIAFMGKDKVNAILGRLPGYKIQIVGNHDINRDGQVIEYAVDERHICYVVDVIDGDMEFQLLFTHYPMDVVPPNCVNVAGHIHNNHANPWNIIICVEHTNYAPMNLKTVIQKARTYLENK
jgi:calcineurin-like phosphoesterase family protein